MSKIYIDLGSGGFNISVEKLNQKENDENTPVLKIDGSILGHKMGEMNIRMTPERLIELGEFLISEGEKSKVYYNNKRESDGWGGLACSKFRKE